MGNKIIEQFPHAIRIQLGEQIESSNTFYQNIYTSDLNISEVFYNGEVKSIDDWVRFSMLYSDVTAITTLNSQKNIAILGIDTNQPKKMLQDYPIPDMITEINTLSGYAILTGDELINLNSIYEKPIKSGKVIVKPYLFELRDMVARSKTNSSVQAVLNSPFDEYQKALSCIQVYENNKVIPLSYYKDKSEEQFELIVPFLSGISISDYLSILEDEEPLLSTLRSKIKKAADQIKKDKTTIKEFIADEIKPNLDILENRFNRIRNIHKLKVYGTVLSFISLSLIAYSTTGFLSALTQISGIGLGTTGLIKSEAEYQDAIGNFKENPYYLLWKLKNPTKKFI